MRGNGTLLQSAVTDNKQDLVRLLLEFGFVTIFLTVSFDLWDLILSGLTLLLPLKDPLRVQWRLQR